MNSKNRYDEDIEPEFESESAYDISDGSGVSSRSIYQIRSRRPRFRLLFGGILLVLLLLIVSMFVVARSLPGSSLYAMRVNTLEPFLGKMRFFGSSDGEIELSLLSRRLDDMKRLQENGNLSGDALSKLLGEIEKHHSALNTFLEEDRGASGEVSNETVAVAEEDMLLTSSAISILRAMERIMETDANHPPEAQQFEDWRRMAADIHEKKIEVFLKAEAKRARKEHEGDTANGAAKEAEKESLASFIGERLAVVTAHVADDRLSRETASIVGDKIGAVSRWLGQDNYVLAIQAVLEAEQRIETEGYLVGTSAAAPAH